MAKNIRMYKVKIVISKCTSYENMQHDNFFFNLQKKDHSNDLMMIKLSTNVRNQNVSSNDDHG